MKSDTDSTQKTSNIGAEYGRIVQRHWKTVSDRCAVLADRIKTRYVDKAGMNPLVAQLLVHASMTEDLMTPPVDVAQGCRKLSEMERRLRMFAYDRNLPHTVSAVMTVLCRLKADGGWPKVEDVFDALEWCCSDAALAAGNVARIVECERIIRK